MLNLHLSFWTKRPDRPSYTVCFLIVLDGPERAETYKVIDNEEYSKGENS